MQTSIIITGLLIVAIGVYFYIYVSKMKNAPLVPDHEKIITLNYQNFQSQTKDKTILIDFWASWCVPCRMMVPILNDVANDLPGNAYVGKVNIEQCQSLAQKFKVRNIPTMILLKNGVEVNRFVGVKNKEFIMKQIQSA